MLLRSVVFAAMAAVSSAAMADSPAAPCAETSFRIYFAPDSASLDATALEMISAAERSVAACRYTELHVAVDAANALGAQRGAAILAALDGRAWDVAQVEPRNLRRVSAGGPEHAEVLITPRAMPGTETLVAAREAGV
ncbi:MAG: hypothetical protein AB7H66_16055 [Hyphomonadaceae bacterium]